MLVQDLFETPESDLNTLRVAQKAARVFAAWLDKVNADTPLKDCGLWRREILGSDAWLVRADEIGLDDPKLYLGLTHDPKNPDGGFVTHGRDSMGTIKFLIMSTRADPGNETDLAYSINWSNFIHEYQHVLDYDRGYLRHRTNMDRKRSRQGADAKPKPFDAKVYYNSPVEFNAYYTQGLNDILRWLAGEATQARGVSTRISLFKSSHLKTYESFKNQAFLYFNHDWRRALTPATMRRFQKRLAKLYQLVAKTWPDMDAIKQIEAENRARQAELDRQDDEAMAAAA